MEALWCSDLRLVWLMVLEALFCKLRFRIICQMKCRVSRGNFIISIICLNFSTFINYRTMAGTGTCYPRGCGSPMWTRPPPIVPVNVAPAMCPLSLSHLGLRPRSVMILSTTTSWTRWTKGCNASTLHPFLPSPRGCRS